VTGVFANHVLAHNNSARSMGLDYSCIWGSHPNANKYGSSNQLTTAAVSSRQHRALQPDSTCTATALRDNNMWNVLFSCRVLLLGRASPEHHRDRHNLTPPRAVGALQNNSIGSALPSHPVSLRGGPHLCNITTYTGACQLPWSSLPKSAVYHVEFNSAILDIHHSCVPSIEIGVLTPDHPKQCDVEFADTVRVVWIAS